MRRGSGSPAASFAFLAPDLEGQDRRKRCIVTQSYETAELSWRLGVWNG
jgi:hypothetical protein